VSVASYGFKQMIIGDLKLKCAHLKHDRCIREGKCTDSNVCVCFQAFMGNSLHIPMLTGS